MNILRRFFQKMLPIALLVTVLVVSVYSMGVMSSRATTSSLYSSPEVSLNDNQARLTKKRRVFKSQEKIEYNLIANDIIKLFRLLDSPGATTLKLARVITAQPCLDGDGTVCSFIIKDSNERHIYPENLFSGMESKKYLGGLDLTTNAKKNDEVEEITVFLKKKYNTRFEVFKLHQLLSNEKFTTHNRAKFGSCDGPCVGGYRDYNINLKDELFPSVGAARYYLRVRIFVRIAGVGFSPSYYKFGPEELMSIRLRVG